MTEQQLQDAVIGICKLYRIAWFHPYLSKRSTPGWPDLALCGPHGFMLRELKSATGMVTAAQDTWGALFRRAGVDWDIWRPADLQSGRIQHELQAIKLAAWTCRRRRGGTTVGVGYKLYRLIKASPRRDWTSGELVVALMIADDANDDTRLSYMTPQALADVCNMSVRGVRDNLAKLADKGFEFRVIKTRDKQGNAVYAVKGNDVQYQVPDIFTRLARAAQVAYGLVDNHPAGGLSTDLGGTAVPRRWHCGAAYRVRAPFDLDFKPPQTTSTTTYPSHNLSWKGSPMPVDSCFQNIRHMNRLTQEANDLITGTHILGRALTHAYDAGDFTDIEAADFVESTLAPLIAEFAAGGHRIERQ